ncbi:Mysoin-binding motif of peroxisomes-domain-containing protein [Gilbertella persicaria]|uniref:Mysoin-binding motif of peroxisomes-domain-containing protein n=1 Tax=Gilbertella persicaria TaxID=101096 RepID=UPI002220954E|nr:Mysoin-binding motif of peroxisomes-domain-containing protein [Gilbertella persicaria]KAI8084263.1 Mysoin-binding motif of peroxisomes-domain-containing protein [Gilbertella persicaria]
MTEFVVYEDSPLAEYLESIDKAEATVKIATPSLSLHNTNSLKSTSKRLDISRIWRNSMFHDTFSISLSRAEESAFEEKFKYLIVTSPLLSEVLSVHKQKKHMNELPFQSTRTTKLGVTNLVATLAVLFGAEKYLIQSKLPAISLFFSTSASLFFFVRHKRRTSIRQLYQIALSKLQAFTDHSDTFDTKIHRVLITIQEIELVSRGFRLSTPLPPISRIEQHSKQRKCTQLRHMLASLLRRAFIVYEEGIVDLVGVVNKKNLATLYDMYNVHSIASLSAVEEDDLSLDQLKKLAQIMHAKRRECMVQLLALDVMTEDHDSIRYDYRQAWKNINDVLSKLVDETEKFGKDLTEALDAEFYKPLNNFDKGSLSSKIEDSRLKKFVHRLSSLEQQLRTMEAKIYLCSEDVRQLNSASEEELKQKLVNEYTSVQKGFEDMALEWQHGKDMLEAYLNPPMLQQQQQQQQEEEPEEPETPIEESEGKGVLLDSEDVADILNLPAASKASVFEAIAGVEKNNKERSTKTRQQRIEEMKQKRIKENEEKAARLDSQTIVHELKSVLDKRAVELDLKDIL